jgi:fructokinase
LRELILHRILGVGELLWDVLPSGQQLGGAPANYSVMAGRLGNHAVILSRIGQDELAQQTRSLLRGYPVDIALLQSDMQHETGRVTVELADGQPSYVIHAPAAWDFMQETERWREAVREADALCFGSLAQRNPVSRQTIYSLVQSAPAGCERIFDVNLRDPYFSAEILRSSITLASVVKMNDLEVPRVLGLMELTVQNSADALRAGAEALLDHFSGLSFVDVTCGGEGSLLVSRDDWHRHPGVPTKVVDTIGAGDAFTAAMTHYLLQGAPLKTLNEAGNRWGSYIASQAGAMPAISQETVARLRTEIEG